MSIKKSIITKDRNSTSAYQKKVFFDRLPQVNKAIKTSNSYSSAYVDTVEYELRSKSKSVTVLRHFDSSSVKNQRFLPPSPKGKVCRKLFLLSCFLTVGGFFDTLTKPRLGRGFGIIRFPGVYPPADPFPAWAGSG